MRACVSLTPRSRQELGRLLQLAAKKTDLAEVRLDFLPKPEKAIADIQKAPAGLEVVATLRPVWEGGKFRRSEKERLGILTKVAEAVDYVDIELKADTARIRDATRASGAKLIISWHDFKKTPPLGELEQMLARERKAGADVCKIVTTATAFSDNTTLLGFVNSKAREFPLVAFCMGELGIASRILSPLFGAAFTYACLAYGREAAAGQVSIDDLREIYRVITRRPSASAA
ncbi:MAG: type I 3-dehydroquinate dehydratase [Candidatus Micrarchaeia archaeon]